MEFNAEFIINCYINMDSWYYKNNPEYAKTLLDNAPALQRFIDDTDFVLVPGKQSPDGKYCFFFDYPNSHTHGVKVTINFSDIMIDLSNYYGNLTIKLDENGIETTFGSDENTCFVADNEGIYDYTLKLDYKYQSEEKADKISEIISHAKNYYPKAFKAKCAKQRERDLKAGTFKC